MRFTEDPVEPRIAVETELPSEQFGRQSTVRPRACNSPSTQSAPGSSSAGTGAAESNFERSTDDDKLTMRPATADLPQPGGPVSTSKPGAARRIDLTISISAIGP